MRRAAPTRAATATRTGRPSSACTGSSVSASRASRYSGSISATSSSRRAATSPSSRDPARAARPAAARAGEGAADLDGGGGVKRVDLIDRGREDDVRPRLAGEAQVALLVARVAIEVLTGAELGGVDEEAHHHQVALGAGRADQREVPLVQ